VIVRNETATLAAPIEARTIRKVRVRILPYLFLLYVISYLDRVNIGLPP
jgi:ACS family tartrate transporter-like MFS transporter